MAALYPDPEDSDESKGGTAAHEFVANALLGRRMAVGEIASNGTPITQEMVDCAEDVLRDVSDTMSANPGGRLLVEHRVGVPGISPRNFGTLDIAYVLPTQRLIFLWDYKFGHGFVPAEENWQMLNYFGGLLCEFASTGWHGWRGVLTVAQPRNYSPLGPLREWRVSAERWSDYYLPKFRSAARECEAPDPAKTTGDHCKHCPARHACPALQACAENGIDLSLRAAPVDLSPAALGLELRYLEDAVKRLEARKTGLEEMALARIRAGVAVPHFTAEHTSGREAWKTDVAEVFALGDLLGVDLRKAPAAITPKQAAKAFSAAGLDGTVIKAYSETPRGGLKLVRAKDNAARLAFEQEKPESD